MTRMSSVNCQSGFNTTQRFMHIRGDATPEELIQYGFLTAPLSVATRSDSNDAS